MPFEQVLEFGFDCGEVGGLYFNEQVSSLYVNYVAVYFGFELVSFTMIPFFDGGVK